MRRIANLEEKVKSLQLRDNFPHAEVYLTNRQFLDGLQSS